MYPQERGAMKRHYNRRCDACRLRALDLLQRDGGPVLCAACYWYSASGARFRFVVALLVVCVAALVWFGSLSLMKR